MKNLVKRALVVVALAASILMLSSCGSQQINTVVDPQLQEVMLNPNKGDTVTWNVPVTFIPPGYSPCESGMNQAQTCKLNVQNELVAYTCPGCPADPEMPVGPADGLAVKMIKSLKAAAAPPVGPFFIFCDGNGNDQLQPTSLTANPPPNASFVVFRGLKGANDWTVTFDTPGVCSPNSLTQADGGCTVATTTANSYTFKAHSSACTANHPASGTLVVNATP